MYPFPQSVTPAVRAHIDAHMALMNELSHTMSRSFLQAVQLNLQLGQSLVEEAANAAQRMLATERPADALSAAAAHARPATDKLRVYQQQLSQLAAATQVDLSRVTEQHVQKTSRTARTLAEDVTRAAVDDTNDALRQQEERIRKSRDAFKQEAERVVKAGAEFQGFPSGAADGAGARPDDRARRDGPAPRGANGA